MVTLLEDELSSNTFNITYSYVSDGYYFFSATPVGFIKSKTIFDIQSLNEEVNEEIRIFYDEFLEDRLYIKSYKNGVLTNGIIKNAKFIIKVYN